MERYSYAEQDSGAGQDFFDAWRDENGPILAENRSDVLNWLTGFRPPEFSIIDADNGRIIVFGKIDYPDL